MDDWLYLRSHPPEPKQALHLAIQDAQEWDNDQLYCFYVNGFEHDERYAFACPYEKQRKRWTPEAVIRCAGVCAEAYVPVLLRLW